MVSNLFFCQIYQNSNDWIVRNRQASAKAIGLNFSSNWAWAALNWVPRSFSRVPQVHFVPKHVVSKQTMCKSVTTHLTVCFTF